MGAAAFTAIVSMSAIPAWAQSAAPATNAQPENPAAANGEQPIIEQKALDLLKAMSAKIAAAKSFSASIRDMREIPSSQGQMLTFFSSAKFAVERPNKMRADIVNDGVDTLAIYDGKTLTMFDEQKNFYVKADAPPTLDEMVKFASESHGIHFAIADFLFSDPYKIFSEGLTNAYVVGPTRIEGAPVQHLAFAAKGIEFELWLDDSSNLPRLFTVTYLDAPGVPHFLVQFTRWSPDVSFPGTSSPSRRPRAQWRSISCRRRRSDGRPNAGPQRNEQHARSRFRRLARGALAGDD
ncbi:DUF2092 domain-containing protein [Segnochrobactrum spirostomi]|nr:DUF2092 domain-containing protein [Segnochrobactrum spirostomi]